MSGYAYATSRRSIASIQQALAATAAIKPLSTPISLNIAERIRGKKHGLDFVSDQSRNATCLS